MVATVPVGAVASDRDPAGSGGLDGISRRCGWLPRCPSARTAASADGGSDRQLEDGSADRGLDGRFHRRLRRRRAARRVRPAAAVHATTSPRDRAVRRASTSGSPSAVADGDRTDLVERPPTFLGRGLAELAGTHQFERGEGVGLRTGSIASTTSSRPSNTTPSTSSTITTVRMRFELLESSKSDPAAGQRVSGGSQGTGHDARSLAQSSLVERTCIGGSPADRPPREFGAVLGAPGTRGPQGHREPAGMTATTRQQFGAGPLAPIDGGGPTSRSSRPGAGRAGSIPARNSTSSTSMLPSPATFVWSSSTALTARSSRATAQLTGRDPERVGPSRSSSGSSSTPPSRRGSFIRSTPAAGEAQHEPVPLGPAVVRRVLERESARRRRRRAVARSCRTAARARRRRRVASAVGPGRHRDRRGAACPAAAAPRP